MTTIISGILSWFASRRQAAEARRRAHADRMEAERERWIEAGIYTPDNLPDQIARTLDQGSS
jgi:hypothetical protein